MFWTKLSRIKYVGCWSRCRSIWTACHSDLWFDLWFDIWVVSDADLSEYGDPTRTDGGYKIQIAKFNSVYVQNLPLACLQGVELSVSVGTAEESRVSVRDPVCDGLCACFGVGSNYGVRMDVHVLIIK